ncbi:MAG TPA: SusC/RagA family TonB-linked outer membrane protein, partial [Flavobacteriaceae bacterium]
METFSQEKVVVDADKTVTVDEVFKMIKEQTKYRFLYQEDMFKNLPEVHLKKGTIRVDKLINQSIASGKFNVVLIENNTILIKEAKTQQQIVVTGKVTDEAGMPVVGATVLIKGTARGTATDFDGSYTITVPNPENVLVFTALGFAPQEITVGSQSVINVTLKEQVSELDEVVLAGYYNTTKREATSNIAQVKSKDIGNNPVSNPIQTMDGRLAGVQIFEISGGVPGSRIDINIRGLNSIANGNDPLYIIDGVPYLSTTVDRSDGNIYLNGTSPLNSINPQDIESIDILKDADATAIYGSRGANGVILITTKKGHAGKTKFNFKMYSGTGTVTKKMDLLNTEQYLELRNEAFANDGATPQSYDYDLTQWDQNRYTDWQEVLFGGTSYTTDFNGSMSGGNDNIQYLVSAGHRKETLVYPGDDATKRTSFLVNLNNSSNDKKFNSTLSINYSINKTDFPNTPSMVNSALFLPPNAPELYDENGELNWENNTWNNPLAGLLNRYDLTIRNLIGNAVLGYKIFPGLEFKTSLGYSNRISDGVGKFPIRAWRPSFQPFFQNQSKFVDHNYESWIIEPQITWNKNIGKGKLNIIVGSTFQQEKQKDVDILGRGFLSESLMGNLKAAATFSVSNYNLSQYRYNAGFGRFNFNWDNKYILNLTGRRDGSSRFGPGKQFANFGAVGFAWNFSEEEILKDNEVLSFGKLRASYGTTGNDQIGNYQYLSTYAVGTPYLGQIGLTPTRLFNPDFAWEVNKKFEVGLDLGFFNDRVLIKTSYYQNRSSNQLVGNPLAPTTGFASIQSNFPAKVENKGIELEISSTNINKGKLLWTSNVNVTFPKNKLLSFPDIESSSYNNSYVVGEPLSIRKVYQYTGVDPETGIYTFQDLDGDGNITANDRQVVRNIGEKFYGGFQNTFKLSSFTLDFLFQFVKRDAPNYHATSSFYPGGAWNQPVEALGRWQNPGDITDVIKANQNFALYTHISNAGSSTLAISDASYIRLKNINLSYNI